MWYYHVCLSLGWPSPAPNADLFFLAPGRCSELSGYTAILAACAPPFLSPGPHIQWALQSTCRAISFLREFMSWAMVLGNLCFFFFFPPSPFGFISARSGKIQPRGPCTTFPETGNAGSAAQSIPMLLEAQLLNCFDAGTMIQEPVARSRVREEVGERKGPQRPSAVCLSSSSQWKQPLNQLKFHCAPVHQGDLEVGSSAPVTYGDSKGSQWVILQYPEWKRDWLFPVSSSTSSKSHQINLVAATFKTNKRNWLTTQQIELRNSSPKRLWLQEVWWGSDGGLQDHLKDPVL